LNFEGVIFVEGHLLRFVDVLSVFDTKLKTIFSKCISEAGLYTLLHSQSPGGPKDSMA
jgi:hypothetical protein